MGINLLRAGIFGKNPRAMNLCLDLNAKISAKSVFWAGSKWKNPMGRKKVREFAWGLSIYSVKLSLCFVPLALACRIGPGLDRVLTTSKSLCCEHRKLNRITRMIRTVYIILGFVRYKNAPRRLAVKPHNVLVRPVLHIAMV